jgi:hypothetical protein
MRDIIFMNYGDCLDIGLMSDVFHEYLFHQFLIAIYPKFPYSNSSNFQASRVSSLNVLSPMISF